MYDIVEPAMGVEKPFKDMKGDERRYRIDDAVRILKSFASIKKDKALWNAAREALKPEIAESQSMLKGMK